MLYMKFVNPFKDFSLLEYITLGIFILYVVFPIQTPTLAKGYITSPIGLIVLFSVAAALFLYSRPVLAVLFVLVAYELLRRSSNEASYQAKDSVADNTVQEYNYVADKVAHDSVNHPSSIQEHLDTQQPRLDDTKSETVQFSVGETLEEEVIKIKSPINETDHSTYTFSDFKPKSDTVNGASPYM